MTTQWIDFAEIKEAASFSAILERYNIKHQRSRGQVSVLCPFHDDSNPSLSVNFERNVFHCFSCEESGDILTFVAKIEKVSVPQAASIIAGCCGIPMNGNKPPANRPRQKAGNGAQAPEEEGNKPLGFKLSLDPTHPYLSGRLTPELIERFGVGFCNKGYLKGRIAIPIHDAEGQLVAYAGRWASDDVPEGVQKYLLPPGFQKRKVLFNYHRVAGVKYLLIVEGYWSVMRLDGLGPVPAVALMGRTLSDEQEELLERSGARMLSLVLDGDEAGRQATEELLLRLSRKFFVRATWLPDGEAPDTVDEGLLLDSVRL